MIFSWYFPNWHAWISWYLLNFTHIYSPVRRELRSHGHHFRLNGQPVGASNGVSQPGNASMETSTGSQWKTSREVLIFSQTWHGCGVHISDGVWNTEWPRSVAWVGGCYVGRFLLLLLCFSYPSLPSTAMNTWGPKGLRICCPKHFWCRHHPVLGTLFTLW